MSLRLLSLIVAAWLSGVATTGAQVATPPPVDAADAAPEVTNEAEPAANASNTLFLSTLESLRNRPLFSPTRTAPQPEPEPLPEPEPVEPDDLEPSEPPAEMSAFPEWMLIGIVRSSSVNRAIFRLNEGAETFSLASGESRDGWTLSTVSRSSVTLENAGGLAEIPLGNPMGEPAAEAKTGRP
jgi:hypothetical protein